jgi:gas vesicle protein
MAPQESKPYNIFRGAIMREGTYEPEEGSRVGTAITFLLIGLGAGAVVGMLFAPKAGRQMRRDLRRGYETARDRVGEWTETARDFAEGAVERGSDFADDLRERVKPLARGIRRG